MSAPLRDPVAQLRAGVLAAAGRLRAGSGELSAEPTVQRPKRDGQGDYATNAAMLLGPVLGEPRGR